MNLLHLGIHDLASAASLGIGTVPRQGPPRHPTTDPCTAVAPRAGALRDATRSRGAMPRERVPAPTSGGLHRAIATLARAATLRAGAEPY